MGSGCETVANHRKINTKQEEATGNRIRKEVVEWRKRIHYLFLLGNPGGGGRKIREECEAGGLGGGGSSNNQSKKADTMLSSHVTE